MLAARTLKTVLAPALVLLPSPNPSVERDMARDISALQRAECEYRGIATSFDELTRAYILQVYEDGQLVRWQAQPSPYNPETETLVTAVLYRSRSQGIRSTARAGPCPRSERGGGCRRHLALQQASGRAHRAPRRLSPRRHGRV